MAANSPYNKIICISILVLIALAGFTYYSWESHLFKKEGVYVLGVVTEKRQSRAMHYRGYYTFKGKQYGTEFDVDGLPLHVGSYFFVEIASGHPKVNRPFPRDPVPRCLTPAGIPAEGWKTLPSYCNNPCGGKVRFSGLRELQFVKDNFIDVQLIHIYSFHGGCSLRNDSLYANVFKGVELMSRDTLLIFGLCRHRYDFANVDYPKDDIVRVNMGDIDRNHPAEVYTALEEKDLSPKVQYLVANIDHNLGHD